MLIDKFRSSYTIHDYRTLYVHVLTISPSMFLLEFRNLWQRLPGSTFQAALLAIGGIVGRRAEMLG